MKKFLSILMAIMMVAMLGITAFAVDGGETPAPKQYTINVANTVSGQDYSLYKLLDLSYNADKDAYYYTVNSAWAAFFAQESISGTNGYVTIGAAGDVTWVTNADAQAFAQAALAYATTHTIATVATTKATASGASFTVTELGYYLVSTSLGALVALDTVSKEDITVYEKNDYPTLTKTVYEDSTNSYGETATADEGENVSFNLHVEVPNNHTYEGITDDGVNKDFVITDTLPAGMTYVGHETLSGDTTPTSLTVKTVVNADKTTTVTFTVAKAYITTTENKTFDITYDAKLNDAAVAGIAETNTAKLTYGTFETTDDTASLTTYKIDVYKYTNNGNSEVGLAGATFILYKMSGTDKLYFVKAADGTVSWTATKSEATPYTTDAEGGYTITFDGLDDDTYYVEETQAPDGYNPQTEPTVVSITQTNNDVVTTANRSIKVLNQTGSELPSTGGIGTTIFYVVGGILMAGAVVLLVTKKKMSVK